jgi:hypothetical protein
MHTYMPIYTYMGLHSTYIHTHSIYIHACMHAYIHTYTHIRMHAHTYVRTYIHTYMHACTHEPGQFSPISKVTGYCWTLFPGSSGQTMKLASRFDLLRRLRMCGAIASLHHTCSWSTLFTPFIHTHIVTESEDTMQEGS